MHPPPNRERRPGERAALEQHLGRWCGDETDLTARLSHLEGRVVELQRLVTLFADALDVDLDRLAALDVIERRGSEYVVDWSTLELAGYDPTGGAR